ncbi:PEP-CTERM sorting domain-containing protein [Verrucomicrobiaceae bacterium 227]
MKNNSSLSSSTIRSLALAALVAGPANGALLYNISSFNNNNSTASEYWIPGITDITVATGLSGTDDAGLLSLQTLRADATTATSGAPRFRNTESGQNNVRGTLTTDASSTQYFQFGILADDGTAINLTSLSFSAVRATGGTTVRGFDIDVSINGGAYTDLGAENVINSRNEGLANYDFPVIDTGINSVDFRVYSTGGGIEYTNFAINGSLDAIPEPSSAILAGLGTLALSLRRRR